MLGLELGEDSIVTINLCASSSLAAFSFGVRGLCIFISACFVTLVLLFHGPLVVSISHSSSPAPPYISSTAAILAFGT
jgi:hypothetical protein